MKVRELLTDESKWCKLYMALDYNLQRCCADSARAKCYCLMGALHRCYPDIETRSEISFRLTDWLGKHITSWNDAPERKFAEVKQLVEELDI